jgi:hypothetical protein
MAAPKPDTVWYLTFGSTCTATGVFGTVAFSGSWVSVGVVTPGVVSHSCTVVGFDGIGFDGVGGAAVAAFVVGTAIAAIAAVMVNSRRMRITRTPLFMVHGRNFVVNRFRTRQRQAKDFVQHKV